MGFLLKERICSLDQILSLESSHYHGSLCSSGMDGCLAILHPFQTVFQSHQDDEKVTMKGCVQWNPVHG